MCVYLCEYVFLYAFDFGIKAIIMTSSHLMGLRCLRLISGRDGSLVSWVPSALSAVRSVPKANQQRLCALAAPERAKRGGILHVGMYACMCMYIYIYIYIWRVSLKYG